MLAGQGDRLAAVKQWFVDDLERDQGVGRGRSGASRPSGVARPGQLGDAVRSTPCGIARV